MKDSETDNKLKNQLSQQRENDSFHLAYEKETAFYETVKNGDIKKLKKIFMPLNTKELGLLSKTPLTNHKYHLIVAIAMITRFCIEGGLPPEEAYTLSDLYIQQLDSCKDDESLNKLHYNAVFDFAKRMKSIIEFAGMSRNIIRTKEFIFNNVHKKISLEEIAANVGMNKTYLCELFKKETGETINKFILECKIKEAKELLKNDDLSNTEISSILCFSSASHFIKTFKQIEGITPGEYREKAFRKFLKRN